MDLVFGHDTDIAAWVAARIDWVRNPTGFGACRAVGIMAQGQLIAGVVYHNFFVDAEGRPANVEMSIAATSPKWCTRGNLRALLHIPFEQYKVRRISVMTPEDQEERVMRVPRWLGFKREAVLVEIFGPGRPAVLYRLTRRQYENGAKLRLAEGRDRKHGQRRAIAPAGS